MQIADASLCAYNAVGELSQRILRMGRHPHRTRGSTITPFCPHDPTHNSVATLHCPSCALLLGKLLRAQYRSLPATLSARRRRKYPPAPPALGRGSVDALQYRCPMAHQSRSPACPCRVCRVCGVVPDKGCPSQSRASTSRARRASAAATRWQRSRATSNERSVRRQRIGF